MEGWVDLDYPAMQRPGVEPATFWSRVRRPNHYTTEEPKPLVLNSFIQLSARAAGLWPFSCLQLLSSNLHNSSFLVSHLLTVSFFCFLFFYSTSFLPIHHAAIHQCHNTGPIHLCLWHHIVFNIFLSSWTVFRLSSFSAYLFDMTYPPWPLNTSKRCTNCC